MLTIENLCTFSLSLSPCPGRKCVLVKLLLLRMPGTRHPPGNRYSTPPGEQVLDTPPGEQVLDTPPPGEQVLDTPPPPGNRYSTPPPPRGTGTRHPQGTGSVNSKICSARSDLICKIVHGSEVICLTKRSHPSRSVTPETAQDSHILPPNYSNIPLCLHVSQHKAALSSDSAEELPTPHLYLYP